MVYILIVNTWHSIFGSIGTSSTVEPVRPVSLVVPHMDVLHSSSPFLFFRPRPFFSYISFYGAAVAH